tara:strand:- start:6349 stop:7311 length:963 start_codon:yes stop_codon:yes gene_type:complete
VEVEAYAIANLCDKMQTGALVPAPIWTDLKTFNFSAFRESMEQGILSGGFPCQPFSSAGLRKATEDPRHLWPYILEGIKQCRPAIVFLENVEGIISAKTGEGESVLKYVLRSLEEVGYRVAAGLFSAAEVGAPHQRKRVFILGHADSSRKQQCKRGKREVRGWSKHTSKELANADSSGRGKNWELSELRTTGVKQSPKSTWPRTTEETSKQRQEGKNKDLANAGREGLKRGICGGQNKEWEGFNGHAGRNSPGISTRWPSGPNEDQHEWEEPRAISKQQMGGTANGASGRVDSLRLLGNGVVPQTVEIAFRTLLTEITNL